MADNDRYETLRGVKNRSKAKLILSDGSVFEGQLLGRPVKSSGEIVFSTGMVGYSEAITDPSYYGQILVFSYPLIGNYGIPRLPRDSNGYLPKGFESSKCHASGVIVTVDSSEVFHWNSYQSLDEWLFENNTVGIAGLDTRHLVHLSRNIPNLKGRIEVETDEANLFWSESGFFDPGEQIVIDQVSTKDELTVGSGDTVIGVVDCGVKWNIIRQLVGLECTVKIVPWNSDFSKVKCDGWLVSNGPGDPTKTGSLVPRLTELLALDKPVIGICLGNQLMALACGAKTKRMVYGHRSHNQPVQLVGTRKGFITSQNHGYVIDSHTLGDDWEPWFLNINDGSIEGLRHRTLPHRSVQFHPEAAGGPRDTGWILSDFVARVQQCH